MYHPGSASALAAAAAAAANATTSPTTTFLPSATPTGLLLTPPSAFYSEYGLSAGATAGSAFTASGYPDTGAILTTFLAPAFGPTPTAMVNSTSHPAGHHHNAHYNAAAVNGAVHHAGSQQAMLGNALACISGPAPSGANVSSTVTGGTPPNNASAISAATAFYLNGHNNNNFLTGVISPSSTTSAYLNDTRI